MGKQLNESRQPTPGNTPPTELSVRAKLDRPGALFASDEVRMLIGEIDRLRKAQFASRFVLKDEAWREKLEAVERQRDEANFARIHAESEVAAQRDVVATQHQALTNAAASLAAVVSGTPLQDNKGKI